MDPPIDTPKASIPFAMKCLLINLDRSPDRLAHMTAEFARIGIEFERVAAVDAQGRPDLAEIPMRLNPLTQLRLANTEIACFLSHKACWAKIADGDDAYGAIFEDDTVLSEVAGPLLADARWIPADADIVKIETFKRTVIAMKRASIGHGFSVARLHRAHLGAAGYIVSRQAARDLLEATGDIDSPVDHILFDPGFAISSSKTIYQMLPALCIQDRFLSEQSMGLQSLLSDERENGKSKRQKMAPLAKFANEAGRIWRQIFDIFQLRRGKTIPFNHHGKRVRPAHTHKREKAL